MVGTTPTPNNHQNQPLPAEQIEINIVAEMTVSTASAIITHPDDPYLILVGDSAKHPYPVLPGGKLEHTDSITDDAQPGLSCVLREVEEEIGTPLLNPRYIGMANDADRDVRVVKVEKLVGAVTTPSFEEAGVHDSMPESTRITAHYGTPDYLYVGTVDPEALEATEELTGNRFIDVRELEVGGLSAGHDVIALRYREMLESGADSIPEESLTDFASERAALHEKYPG